MSAVDRDEFPGEAESLDPGSASQVDMMPIDSVNIGERHREHLGDIPGLAASIQEVGLLHPIVVTADHRLIAGRRRLEAYKTLGRRDIPVRIIDLDAVVRGEFDENVHRKAFTPTEAVGISRAVSEEEEALAKARQGTRSDQHPAKFAESEAGESRVKAARVAGLSHATIKKASAVMEAADAEPDKYRHLVEAMDQSGKVDAAHKRLIVAKKVAAIAMEPPPLPTGQFRVIVADPPWPFDKQSADPSQRATHPYPQMAIDEIKALDVQGRAHDDSVLWLWTTNHHMPEAIEVAEAWGFEHRTILTWVKDRMGMGSLLRGQTEHCLLAVRGKPTFNNDGTCTTVLQATRDQHSEKPDEFYELVERLCPGSKVDFFQRTPRDGWAGYGDEVQPTAPAQNAVADSTVIAAEEAQPANKDPFEIPPLLDRRLKAKAEATTSATGTIADEAG